MQCERELPRQEDMEGAVARALYRYFVGNNQHSALVARTGARDTIDHMVTDAMNRMDPGLRAIISLHDVDGYNLNEISEILGAPAGTLKYRLDSARAYLRTNLRAKLMEPYDGNRRGT